MSRATEWIGWDPATSQVHSWSFEADGGIDEGVWSNEGDQWIIKTNAILPDGKKLVATNIVTRNVGFSKLGVLFVPSGNRLGIGLDLHCSIAAQQIT
jgi:hypothetical protein